MLEFVKENVRTHLEKIVITVTAQRQINIAQRMPQQIGTIYGINTHVTGVDSDNTTLITLVNSFNLFLTIKSGSDNIIRDLKLADILYLPTTTATTMVMTDRRYFPVNIPNIGKKGGVNLDTSFITNPTGIASGRIVLYFWYIPKDNSK